MNAMKKIIGDVLFDSMNGTFKKNPVIVVKDEKNRRRTVCRFF